MCRLTRLFFAVVICAGGLTAGLIDFEGDVTDGAAQGSISRDGTTVSFFTTPSGVLTPDDAFGAVQGLPKTAFENFEEGHDVADGAENGDFLTDEPTGQSIAKDYLFSILGFPIVDFGLDLYDFGDGGSSAGGTATLQAFSDPGWLVPIGAPATYLIAGVFNDGNIQNLFVSPGASIGSVRLSFSLAGGQDVGTGVDNIAWTAIPEPGTVALFGTGLLALAAIARRRRIRGDAKES